MTLSAVGNDNMQDVTKQVFCCLQNARGGTLLNSKCPAPGTNLASNAQGLRGAGEEECAMLAAGTDSHIISMEAAFIRGQRLLLFFLSNAAFNRINTVKDVLRSISLCVCVSLPYNNVLLLKVHQQGSQDVI